MYERLSLFVGKLMMLDASDLKREEGQGVTEYTLVLAFVAVALAAVLIVLKGGIRPSSPWSTTRSAPCRAS